MVRQRISISVFLALCLGFTLAAGIVLAESGSDIYDAQCASCHDNAAGRTPTKKMMNDLSAGAIVTALETGVMRVIGSALLWQSFCPEKNIVWIGKEGKVTAVKNLWWPQPILSPAHTGMVGVMVMRICVIRTPRMQA